LAQDFDSRRRQVDTFSVTAAMASLCSAERALILVTCLGAYFLSMAMIYQMSPFFEVYARETCNASTLTVGFIFAAMPASAFFGNLAMDGMIRKFGVQAMLNCGLLLLAVSSLGFGFSSSVPSWMCWRVGQGLATAPIYTSISTRLARTFTGEGEFHRVVGLQEVCGNVGFTIGPLLGGALFQNGGFSLPFITSAGLHLLLIGISLASLPWKAKTNQGTSDPSEAAGADSGALPDMKENSAVTTCSVTSLRLVLLAGIPMLCLGVWGGYEPLLGDHFVQVLGPINHTMIGFLISLAAVPSTFAAMSVPALLKCFGAKWLMTGGLLSYACGNFVLGSWTFLTPWASQIGGLLLIGCGWGLCWTPVLPSMVNAAASKLTDTPSELARHQVSPPVSSIFNASAALGEAVGPLLGTWLLPGNFHLGPKVIAMFLAVYAACICCSHPGSQSDKMMHVDQVPTQTQLRPVIPDQEDQEHAERK